MVMALRTVANNRVLLNVSHFNGCAFIACRRKSNTIKEFSERKLVGYSMDQLYVVVSDVENYCRFLPFCKKSNVYARKKESFKADLVLGIPPINEAYTSNVLLIQPSLVKAESREGVLFKHLITSWRFGPGLLDIPQSCVTDFYVRFEFKSELHWRLSGLFFDQLVRQMEHAFINEAGRRYGPPTIKSHLLQNLQKS